MIIVGKGAQREVDDILLTRYAYYQWLTRRSFAHMQRKGLGAKEVMLMYHPLHEADLSRFAAADSIIEQNKS